MTLNQNESESTRFRFSEKLDWSFLDEMYDGDIVYAEEVFEMVLDSTLDKLQQVQDDLGQGNTSAARPIVHKMVPTLRMVGLTDLYNHCSEILLELEKGNAVDSEEIEKVQIEFKKMIPVLEEEVIRLRSAGGGETDTL